MSAAASHERYEELAAGHALASLEPGEEQEFLQHLSGCARCERSLSEHLDTLSHLAYAVDAAPLPDALLMGIRAEVAASGRQSGLLPSQGVPVEPTRLDEVRRQRWRRAPQRLLAVAAAAALVLSLGVWNVALQRHQSVNDARSERLTAAVQLLESPATRRVELSDGSGRAVAFAVLHGTRGVSLIVSGLEPNDPHSSIYVLWQTGDAGTRAIGTFDIRDGEIAVVRNLALAKDLPQYKAFAVTRESGRTAPRAPGVLPVANGSLSA